MKDQPEWLRGEQYRLHIQFAKNTKELVMSLIGDITYTFLNVDFSSRYQLISAINKMKVADALMKPVLMENKKYVRERNRILKAIQNTSLDSKVERDLVFTLLLEWLSEFTSALKERGVFYADMEKVVV